MAPANHRLQKATIGRQAPGQSSPQPELSSSNSNRKHPCASLQALAFYPLMKPGLPASDHSDTLHRRYG